MLTDMKKNDELVLTIDDLGNNGEGIGHVDGYALFVKGALPDETVRVRLMKLNKSYGFARLLEVLEPSPMRVEPLCRSASACGGCTLQHLSYEGQLRYKEKKVRDCLTRIGGVDLSQVEWLPILGMTDEEVFSPAEPHGERAWHYRNKAQFPVRCDKEGKPAVGFFAGRSHRLIPVSSCDIQHPVINEVVNCVLDFIQEYDISPYDEERHTGLVRHIYVRRGYHTGQVMVCLVVNERESADIHGALQGKGSELVRRLCEIEGMTSIFLNVNAERTNVILGREMILLWGQPYIEDRIGDIRYRISPQSFYQVNPVQTEKLYATTLSFAGLTGTEKVWDLYCGIGTISLFLAQHAAHVFGVEIVPEAIENAKENARLNGIHNVSFVCGAAEKVASDPEKCASAAGAVDVIVVDPPRKGCDATLLDTMVRMAPERIVYVSCDPATLARDVKRLGENGYEIRKVQAVDMFPQGGHVETVVQLSLKKDAPKIEVTMEPDEESRYTPEEKATYPKIREYVKEKYGVDVHTSYIAEVKRMCDLEMGQNYNKSKKENPVVRHCPQEKVVYIEDALKYYGLI